MPRSTLYESLGGMDGVLRLAHAWHERCLQDEVVAHAFSRGYHPQHTQRLAAYWAEAWGGPAGYSAIYGTESSVVRMHSGNGEHDDMDARAIGCFAMALDDIGTTDPDLRRALLDYFTWTTTTTMAAYPRSRQDVPEGLRLPRWSWTGLEEEACMSGPARTGVLLYAKDLLAVSAFYEQVLGARVLHADNEHRVLQSPDIQLIIHAIPREYAGAVVIETPPRPREDQAIKPFFTVDSLAATEPIVEGLGGRLHGPVWPGPGMRVRNVCDPEGNIVHLREHMA